MRAMEYPSVPIGKIVSVSVSYQMSEGGQDHWGAPCLKYRQLQPILEDKVRRIPKARRTIMITPLAAQNRRVLQQAERDSRPRKSNPATAKATRPAPAQLAASIMSDGGLSFLQARLEEKLAATFNTESTDKSSATYAPETATDLSPNATADRIVGFALGLRNTFSRQNADLDESELMARFEAEVRRGIEAGFAHARGTLGDLNLLKDEVPDNVDATYAAVQQKLADYFQPSNDQ